MNFVESIDIRIGFFAKLLQFIAFYLWCKCPVCFLFQIRFW